MWKQVKVPFCGILVLLFSAAGMMSDSAAEATLSNASIRPDTSSSYYIVTRLDPRLCPSPLCGGYFVKAVNKPKTQCADGTWRRDCHAAELDASALGWSDDELARFSEQFGQRHALVRGKLRQMERGSLKVDVLVVDEGWLGQALSKPIGVFYGAKSTGIVCITFPCLSIHERTLNFRIERLIAEIDLAASGAAKDQVEAGYKALSEPAGVLAVGEHHVIAGPAGRGLKLVTSEFYLPVVGKSPPEGEECGGFIGLPCPEGQFCDINACGADLRGICRIPPQVCAKIYDPVCGCDGVTYGNDCERQAAKIPLDHPGECLKE
jgi:hypothetical protein